MKKFCLLTAVLAILVLLAYSTGNFHNVIYKVDTKLSKLEWFAEKLTGKHNGTLQFSGGEIQDNHGQLTGRAEVDMTTIKNLDVQNAEYKAKLENHLKSPDFFDVATYSKSTFTVTSVTPIANAKPGAATHRLKGNLTIKNKTNEIGCDAVIVQEGNKINCTGELVIDRSKFDVKYGSKTFFSDIGDKVIYDDFTLKFTIIAIQ